MPTFNCLTEPWIFVRSHHGILKEVGIREAILSAHELESVYDPSPLVQFGIYRLLIAFVSDAYGVLTPRRIADLIRRGSFDANGFDDYVAKCGDAFDLFSQERPFLQSCPDSNLDKEPKSVASLYQHLPSGSNVTHFCHGKQVEHQFSPPVCARAICTISPFMTSGGAGLSPSINGIPPWYVLIKGKNLFETLTLNCCIMALGLSSAEPVAWLSQREVSKQELTEVSLLGGLTWQPRRVRLLPGEGGACTYSGRTEPILVREVQFSAGFAARTQEYWVDPNVAYRLTDKGRLTLKPDKDRAVWRDVGPLSLLKQHEYVSPNGKVRFDRPAIVGQFVMLRQERYIDKKYELQLEVYGLETDGKMKMIDWRYEKLALPYELSEMPEAPGAVQVSLQLAEDIAYALGQSLKLAYPREGKGNAKAFANIMASAKRSYWGLLESAFFTFLGAVSQGKFEAAMEAWKKELQRSGWTALEQVLSGLDVDADALQRQVEVRRAFGQRLGRILSGKELKNEQSNRAE